MNYLNELSNWLNWKQRLSSLQLESLKPESHNKLCKAPHALHCFFILLTLTVWIRVTVLKRIHEDCSFVKNGFKYILLQIHLRSFKWHLLILIVTEKKRFLAVRLPLFLWPQLCCFSLLVKCNHSFPFVLWRSSCDPTGEIPTFRSTKNRQICLWLTVITQKLKTWSKGFLSINHSNF